jgi:hypothetical protein
VVLEKDGKYQADRSYEEQRNILLEIINGRLN